MSTIFVSTVAFAILASSPGPDPVVAPPGGQGPAQPVAVQPIPWRTFPASGQMEPAQRIAVREPALRTIVREPVGRIVVREPAHQHAWWRRHHPEPVTILLEPEPYHGWWRRHHRDPGSGVYEFN